MSFNKLLQTYRLPKDSKQITKTHTSLKGGSYYIPKDELNEFYKQYLKYVFEDGGDCFLVERQTEQNNKMIIDLDFRYSLDITKRQHTLDDVWEFTELVKEEINKVYSFKSEDYYSIYVFEKPNINPQPKDNVVKDGVHIIFSFGIPYHIQLKIRQNIINKIKDNGIMKHLPLINDWEGIYDDKLTQGSNGLMMLGSIKNYGEETYEFVACKQVFHNGDDEFIGKATDPSFGGMKLELFTQFSSQLEGDTFQPNNDTYNWKEPVVKSSKTNKPKIKNETTETETNNTEIQIIGQRDIYNDEIRYYIENKSFDFGKGTHLEWVVFGGLLKTLCSEDNAFKLWKQVTQTSGSTNKQCEYDNKWRDVKAVVTDTLLAIKKIRKIVLKNTPTLCKTWVEQQKNKIKQAKELEKETIKQSKELEKETIKQSKEREKENKQRDKQLERELERELEEQERQHRKCNNKFVKDDNEAIDIIYDNLKDNLIYTWGTIFIKRLDKNLWINDNDLLHKYLLNYILKSDLYRENEEYQLIPYSAFVTNAKHILEGLISRIISDKQDDSKYRQFHTSTKNIICFNDGILNFKTNTFTLWKDVKQPIFTTINIDRNYKNYFDNPIQEDIEEVKKLFKGMFGNDTNKVLQFYSRAISGNYEDKKWLSFRGNRDCGKGVLYDALKSSFENYVCSFNLENIVCQRQSKKSSDTAKENAWLIPLEFARIAISQETPDNENENLKQGLKLDNKVMKSVVSGGDEQQARKLYKDTFRFTIDAALCFFGNNDLSIDGDANKHHLITSGVTQYISKEEYEYKKEMYDETYMSSYGIRDETLKDKVKTDNYKNAMVYLLYNNWSNQPVTISHNNCYGDDNKNITIRDLIYKHYEVTKNEKDRVPKDELISIIGKDKKKIIDELRQMSCVDAKDKCRTTIYWTEKCKDKDGKDIEEKKSKQVQAFYKLKKRDVLMNDDELDNELDE